MRLSIFIEVDGPVTRGLFKPQTMVDFFRKPLRFKADTHRS
jgi:hypothetical protein